MFSVFIHGLLLSTAMIIAIGAQNAFLLTQSIKRQYHLMIASVCFISDAILISFGVFSGGRVLSHHFFFLQLLTWCGVIFLVIYGWHAAKQAWKYQKPTFDVLNTTQSRKKTLLIVLAVTWLNPNVYLDTVVIIGSSAAQFSESMQPQFAIGAITASFIWFYGLAFLAAYLSQWLQKPLTQRLINAFIAIVMWNIAFQLTKQGYEGILNFTQ